MTARTENIDVAVAGEVNINIIDTLSYWADEMAHTVIIIKGANYTF